MAANIKPVHTIRIGCIKAAIWSNTTSKGRVRHSVTVERLFKDVEKGWRSTASFGRDDLPVVAKVLSRAHDWIFERCASHV